MVTNRNADDIGNCATAGPRSSPRDAALARLVRRLLFRQDDGEDRGEEEKRPVAENQNSTDLIAALVDASPDVMILIDRDGHIVFANVSALERTPPTANPSASGAHWQEFISPSVHAAVGKGLQKALTGRANRFRVEEKRADRGGVWWDATMTPLQVHGRGCTHVLLVARDCTEDHARAQTVKWSASHDPLTELPNRRAFTASLDRLVRKTDSSNALFALLLIDIDHLHVVNEAYGSDAGDALLVAIAKRIRGGVRRSNLVARVGKDEFAVILTGLNDPEELPHIVSRIKSEARRPLQYRGQLIDFRLSVGVAVYPDHGEDAEEMLRSAEAALNESQQAGGARMAMFKPEMRSRISEKAAMISTAKNILRENRLLPYYQPKVVLTTGLTAGFEALFRYRHPTLGVQGPAAVSAAMDDASTASQIGERMQRMVLADMREWLQLGLDFGHVAINVADAEFHEEGFAERLLERLRRFEVPAEQLKLEITESVLLDSKPHHADRTLSVLNAAGVRLSLDDFGTGYASLVHLKRFPVHEIKIDRSFVRDLPDPNAVAIVRAMLGLGENLGIAVVAEGVEEAAQAHFLREEGCRFAQGYLFGRAASAADAVARIAGEAKEMRAAG